MLTINVWILCHSLLYLGLSLLPFNFHFPKCLFLLLPLFPFPKRNHIIVLPHINPFAFEEEANSGDSVQLTCHASKGDLPLTIKWLHNGLPMFSHLGILTNKIGDRISLLTISWLKIKIVAVTHVWQKMQPEKPITQQNYTLMVNKMDSNDSAFKQHFNALSSVEFILGFIHIVLVP